MKVLFVNPSLRPEIDHRYLPVGLGYVVTAVKEAGIAFDLLDIDIGNYSNSYVEQYLEKNRYDVICFGCIVTHYRWSKWFIHTIKKYQPDCKVVVGNSVGSSIPEVLFAHTPVDVVVLGEGDVTIVELLEALEAGTSLGEMVEPPTPVPHKNGTLPATLKGDGIAGIVFRDKLGRIINNGRRKAMRLIDDFPYPDWDIFNVEDYIVRSKGRAYETTFFAPEDVVIFPVNTARGCVFKCTFCNHQFWHDPYRHRSPENIIGEIKRNKEKYGANYINFWDELSFHKVQPAEKFVDAMLAADLGVHWTAAVRSDLFGRPDVPYEDRLRLGQKFKKAGCLSLGFSLESGNDQILEAMNKRVKSDYFREQVLLLKKVGVATATSVVLGYPQETVETIGETMRMCEDLRVYPSVGFLLPLPETGMWAHAIDNRFITDIDDFLENRMTERQDIVLNMTEMSNDTILDEVQKWLDQINTALGRKVEGDLIRTKGHERHNKHQNEEVIKAEGSSVLNFATVTGKF